MRGLPPVFAEGCRLLFTRLPPVFAVGCRLLCRADFCPLDCGAFLHVVRRIGNFNVRAVSIGIGQDNHRRVCLEEVGILIGF